MKETENKKVAGKTMSRLKILLLSLCMVSLSAGAEPLRNLEDSWYVGGAAGLSMLEPDTPDGASVVDDKGLLVKVYGGVDITSHIGLEAFWMDLGTAKVEGSAGDGGIKYSAVGINGIYHFPVNVRKVHPFGKLGLAKIRTKADEDVHEKRQNNFSAFAGVGAVYDINKQLKLRTEYDYYTKDLSQFNVGLNWSPGDRMHGFNESVRSKPIPAALPVTYTAPPAKVIQPVPVPRPVAKPMPRQQKTKVKRVVQSLNASLSGKSLFASGSSVLSASGRSELDRLVELTKKPGFRLFHITITGHTDNVGSRLANIRLSKRRAESVAQYLEMRGVLRKYMSVVGYGDSQPIATNSSAYGRSKNRRVEVKIRGEQSVEVVIQ